MPSDYEPSRRRWLSVCGVAAMSGTGGCLRLIEGEQTSNSTRDGTDTDRSETTDDTDSNRNESQDPSDESTVEAVTDVLLTEIWQLEGKSQIANTATFVSLDEGFFAYRHNLDSGQSLQRFESDGAISWESDPIPEGYWFRSRLWNVIAANSDTVYAGTRSLDETELGEDQEPGTGSRLYAFDRTTGTVEWFEETDDEFRDRTGYVELIDDVVVYTARGPVDADQSVVLRGIDSVSGQRLWSESLSHPVAGIARIDGKLVVATGGGVSVHDSQSGTQTDRFDVSPPSQIKESLLVRGDQLVYTYNSTDDTVVALDIQSGDIRWTEPFGPEPGGLCVGVRTVVLQGRDGVVAGYSADSGERRWTIEVDSTSSIPPRAQKGIFWVDGTGTTSVISETSGEIIHEREFEDDRPQELATHDEIIVFSREAAGYAVTVS